MVESKSPHQIVKSILRLPNDGPLNSFDKYLKAAEYLNLETITQDEVMKALLNGDHLLLDYFKRTFFYQWDASTLGSLGFNSAPSTKERRKEIYKILEIKQGLIEIFESHIGIIVPRNDEIFIDEKQAPSWVDEENWFYWEKYSEFLINKYGEQSGLEIVRSLDDSSTKILNILQDPTAETISKKKGLVVGYVQSGKTSNMQALVSKAIDSGYKLIIVLSGDKNILRNQTQRRFDKEIFGKEQILRHLTVDVNDVNFLRDSKMEYYDAEDWNDFVSFNGMPRPTKGKPNIVRLTTSTKSIRDGMFDQINLHPSESSRFNTKDNLRKNDAYVAIITKNGPSIDKVITQLNITQNKGINLQEVPALVIDDESDSSSVGTQKIGEPRRRVNQAIINLLERLPKAQYVGYTATPYANVFIDYEDEDDLFPRHFINVLDRPPNYMGASDFLTDENNQNPYVKRFNLENEDEKLLEAIDSFIISGALKIYREKTNDNIQKFDHHTMLVHTSAFKKDHDSDIEKIEKLLKKTCDYSGRVGKARLKNLYEVDFIPKITEFNIPTFEELSPFIDEANSRLTDVSGKPRDAILLVNGSRDGEDPDFGAGPVWKILVGGAKLSRGYTVEGLTVSYFKRATNANDTLMQMGRWFGFRKNYKDLVRLYITMSGGRSGKRDLFNDFMGACIMEEDFRQNIKIHLNKSADEIVESNISPLTFKKFVRESIGLAPTAPGKRRAQTSEKENWGGWSREIWWYPNKNEIDKTKSNLELGNELFSKYKLTKIEEKLELDLKDVNTAKKMASITGYTTLIDNPDDFLEFLKNYQWQKGKENVNSSIINFLEKKFLAKREDEVNIEIENWRIIFPQLINNKKEKYPFANCELDIFHRERDEKSNHKSYPITSGGEVHTLISEWLAVGHNNSAAKSFMGYPNSALENLKRENTSIALFYLIMDYSLGESTPTLGYRLHFNDNKMPRGKIYQRQNQDSPTVIT